MNLSTIGENNASIDPDRRTASKSTLIFGYIYHTYLLSIAVSEQSAEDAILPGDSRASSKIDQISV